MAYPENPDKVPVIIDLIQDTVEVRLLAIDELTHGSVLTGHHAHAWSRFKPKDEVLKSVEPARSGRRLFRIDASV